MRSLDGALSVFGSSYSHFCHHIREFSRIHMVSVLTSLYHITSNKMINFYDIAFYINHSSYLHPSSKTVLLLIGSLTYKPVTFHVSLFRRLFKHILNITLNP
ncbi:hypothetical protein DFO74_1542 [Chromohalobacter israelensis]|nr:hypothetical protein DFO74_1542 [Chromohalobacter salexigens]